MSALAGRKDGTGMKGSWDEKKVFLHALGLPSASREEYLASACPDDAASTRIRSLLAHHAASSTGVLSSSSAEKLEAAATPRQLDEFRILRRIGEGGMGIVYLAHDNVLNRHVALKVLAPHLVDSERAVARFQEEARASASLHHPGIVQVYRFGSAEGVHYLVSEYVEGATLAEVVEQERQRRLASGGAERAAGLARSERLGWYHRCAEIVADVAQALDAAHRSGIVHADVKPGNILMSREGNPRLADFGLARPFGATDQGGGLDALGTCYYLSPEQASAAQRPIDRRSDVFSLGVVLYEALTLARPFDGTTISEVLRVLLECAPEPIEKRDRFVPIDLAVICQKALDRHPDHRYQTAAHFAADLRSFTAGLPIMARPPSWRRRVVRWGRSHVLVSTAIATVLLGGSTVALALSRQAMIERSHAWFSVQSEIAGCSIWLAPVDSASLEYAAATTIGSTPLDEYRVAPGQYRVTVVTPDGADFVDFNLVAFLTGREAAQALDVRQGSRPHEPEPSTVPVGGTGAPTRLVGYLRGDAAPDLGKLVAIEGGTREFGGPSNGTDPIVDKHMLTVAPFSIGRYEVSNDEYLAFCVATGHRFPALWPDGDLKPELRRRPVTGVSLFDAEAYARWCGCRLPTHHEWEFAMRAPDERLMPWGDDDRAMPEIPMLDMLAGLSPDYGRAIAAYERWTMDVDSAPDLRSSTGLFHGGSNVGELTAIVHTGRSRGVIRKGHTWMQRYPFDDLRRNAMSPYGTMSFTNGFRVARSAAPPSRANDSG